MTLRKIEIKADTQIEYSSKELLFLGHSGQPYRGSVFIRFISQGESFDLRDFKKYLTSLRSQTFYAEDISRVIYSLIDATIKSQELGVVVDLGARGGIQQRIAVGHPFIPVKKENIFQIN